MKKLVACGR